MPQSTPEVPNPGTKTGHWFLGNPTAANLLMWIFIAGGIVAIFTMRQEVFPTALLATIEIQAEYRGATAAEVEAEVVQPMEQSIDSLRDIRTVVSEIRSGGANIFVMLEESADVGRSLDEIRSAVDSLGALPADLDPPTIVQVRDSGGELDIGFYGFKSRALMHAFTELARQRLLALPTISQVEVDGAGEPEITVSVAPDRARLYGLSLRDVAEQVQRASFELSGGAIRRMTGEYGLSAGLDRRYAHEFRDIAIVESPSGSPLTLAEIADVENGFRPHGKRFRINGSLGVMMTVYGAGATTPGEVSSSVREVLAEIEAEMPVGAVVLDDDARSYADRVGILADSALIGLLLVLLLLFLVLEARVAFWVAVGLPVALLGGVALFALTPYTINFISIFAFIIVIGVVVDDAVVVGESIYAGIQAGMTPLAAAADTIDRFSVAISIAIATNIIAFMPIFFMPGQVGLFLLAIPVVTTCVFMVSLIEALWILPAHLAYGKERSLRGARMRLEVQRRFDAFRESTFMPFVAKCLANRGLVVAVGVAIASAMFSWAASGRIPVALQPSFESDQIVAVFALTPGASERQVDETAAEIEQLGRAVLKELGEVQDIIGVTAEIGAPSSHQGRVSFTFVNPENRDFGGADFAAAWRDRIGQPAKLTQLSINYLQGPGDGRDLTVEIAHADPAQSRQAAEDLVRQLREVPGVVQISYSGNEHRSEVRFELNAAGRALGFDEAEISSRLRAQLDGLEATRLTRGTDEVRVMIRGDHGNTGVLPDLEGLILTASNGRQAALGDIADIHWERGVVQLRRINGERIERVEASVDRRIASPGLIDDLVSEDLLLRLEAAYPGLATWDEAIDTDEESETARGLMIATIGVLVAIFVIIAAYVRSLGQAAILMSCIPLCAAGAILGHVLLGLSLSAATFLGVLALGGLVINAGLLLHLRFTEALLAGAEPTAAMMTAVSDRFRPIVLSSATTLLGLAPLIFGTAIQAAAMRPIAVSVGFGMLFSIPVILIVMPAIVITLQHRQRPVRRPSTLSEGAVAS